MVKYICPTCKYKFKSEKKPKICPYCDHEGPEPEKSAEELISLVKSE